jgi:hypothetical protein
MPARGRSITRHTISEVFYDNAWHMIDGSLMNYFRRPDGVIASAHYVRPRFRGSPLSRLPSIWALLPVMPDNVALDRALAVH